MSDVSNGPGWWQASDGKWYAPESHPNAQVLTAPRPATPPHAMAAPPQMAPTPTYAAAPPPQKKGGGKGCLIALIVVGLLMAAGVGVLFLGGKWVSDQVDNGNAFGKTSCDAISTQDLNSTLGGNYEVLQLGGITNLASVATDTRIIGDAKSCLATQSTGNGGGANIRIARYEGADAATRFQNEKTKAKGTKEDRGNGLSVESSSYFNKDVQAGDEAFCTTSDMTLSSGAFVRKGNTLVYVSMMSTDSLPTFDPSTTLPAGQTPTVKFGNDDKNCENALKVIDKIK